MNIAKIFGNNEYPISFDYDNFGRQISMTTYRNTMIDFAGTTFPQVVGDVTRWEYDRYNGLVSSKTDAASKSTTYAYDVNNQLIKRIWARGIETNYQYNNLGNLTNISYSDNTAPISISYDRVGNPSSITDATGTRNFTYNSQFALTSESIPTIVNGVLNYSYDHLGRKNLMTLSNGTTEFAKTTYGFDTIGRFASVGNGSHDVAYNYNDKNQLVSKILGENYQVGYSYDEFGRLVNIGGVSYTYDTLNRRTSMTQNSDTINYSYNDRSELIGATNNTNYNYSYSFDPIGNRINASLASENLSYSTNLLNQYTSITSTVSTTPTYDFDGNMLTHNGWSYTWNGENRLVRAENATTKLEFDYDYMGRRIYKKVYENNILTKHIKFIYDGYKLIAEFDALNNDNLIANYTWQVNPQDVPVMATINGTTALYIPDGNKNIVKLLSLNGEVLAEYRYSPFGKVVSSSGILAEANPFRFSSEYHDDETNLVYYNYRYYSPSLGRWLSRDPIEEQGGYNLYAMVKNNVINWLDILGLASWPAEGQLWENWGGKNWGNGRVTPPDEILPPYHESLPGVDDLDNCYKDHDYCYEKCETTCPDNMQFCKADCDFASVSCQMMAAFNNPLSLQILAGPLGSIVLGTMGIGRGAGAGLDRAYRGTMSGLGSAYRGTSSTINSVLSWITN